jgi:hypothetical protein
MAGVFDTTKLTQFVLLADALLKRCPKDRSVKALTCERCGQWTGAVANSAAAAFGHFAADVDYNDGVLAVGTRLERSVLLPGRCEIQCQCGFTTRRHR